MYGICSLIFMNIIYLSRTSKKRNNISDYKMISVRFCNAIVGLCFHADSTCNV